PKDFCHPWCGARSPLGVKLRRTECEHMFSALPPKADIHHGRRHVQKGQELTHAPQQNGQLAANDVQLAANDVAGTDARFMGLREAPHMQIMMTVVGHLLINSRMSAFVKRSKNHCSIRAYRL